MLLTKNVKLVSLKLIDIKLKIDSFLARNKYVVS